MHRDLRFGTSAERTSSNTRDGFTGTWPDGDGHAVPAEATVALCGVAPAYLWTGPFDPGSRVLRICPDCARAAALG